MARFAVAFLGAAAALVMSAAGAEAATVRVASVFDKADDLGDRIYLRAGGAEGNNITIAQETPTTVTIADRVPLSPGSG